MNAIPSPKTLTPEQERAEPSVLPTPDDWTLEDWQAPVEERPKPEKTYVTHDDFSFDDMPKDGAYNPMGGPL